MASSTAYRPSPLSIGSPRTSPFKRPTSPLPPSPSTVRAISPLPSPTKPFTSSESPEKVPSISNQLDSPSNIFARSFNSSATNNTSLDDDIDGSDSKTIKQTPDTHLSTPNVTRADFSLSPMRQPNFLTSNTSTPGSNSSTPLRPAKTFGGDALSRLHPAQVRQMRESFQVLDRDNDSTVTRDDVSHMLSELNLDNSGKALNNFFPASSTQTLNLATYLTTLSSLLSPLSSPDELLAAFSAFDDDDSGQADVAELRDALLHTVPEPGGASQRRMTEMEINEVVGGFSGRRAFAKGLGSQGQGRGNVFRYREFVSSLAGGDDGQEGEVKACV